ncbi:hypothetical protein Taro_047016 [Colocasia esculenta]|uniref:RNase H type-1 domain-containing protein n=1 Tax=Colocasia esculenta TaxID=4460 RepID=A0A843X005_COLES|nr:hypothetical protein [Colocasia esculenta]
MSAKHIVNRTMLSVHAVSSNFKTQQLPQAWSKALKKNGDNRLQKKITAPMVIKWMHPPVGRLKLNVDGAFKSATGSAGGVGILGDHNGRCICAFAKSYQGTISALDAEARALRDGLAMCCSKGFLDIMVETDSLMLIQSVTGQSQHPWDLTCIFQEMAEINHKLTTQIQHIPREANQIAHHLAGYGCSTDQTCFWELEAVLPHIVKGPYQLDKVGGCSRKNLSTSAIDSSALAGRAGTAKSMGITGGTSTPGGGGGGATGTTSSTIGGTTVAGCTGAC